MSSSSWADPLLDEVNRLLLGIDHSAKNNRKYRALEQYLSGIVDTHPADVYAAYISKAGNASVRFNQSERARSANLLVALADPPETESIERTVDALAKYCGQDLRRPQLLLLIRSGNRWLPHAAIYSRDRDPRPRFLKIFIGQWPAMRHVEAYEPEERAELFSIGAGTIARMVERERSISNTDNLNARGLTFFPYDDEIPPGMAKNYPYAELLRERWDDHSIRTLFYLTLHLNDETEIDVGEVKIAAKGQRAGETVLPGSSFLNLGPSYYSLGQSYTFYQTLYDLGPKVYRPVLKKLNDVVFDPRLRKRVESEVAFQKSLKRTGKAARALEDASVLFELEDQSSVSEGLSLDFEMRFEDTSFTVDFQFGDSARLPDRINAVIGYNGTGKTQLLAHIALVATSDLDQRLDFSEFGRILNSEKVRFSSVIAISYSAFDTFILPDAFWRSEEKTSAQRRLESTGEVWGYTYCGLRKRTRDQKQSMRGPRGLKSINELSEEFDQAVRKARSLTKQNLWIDALAIIFSEPSLGRIGMDIFAEQSDQSWRTAFDALSTGHKIVLNIIAQVIGHAEPGSLVLIDEPESHLHPSLLAALIRALNVILTRLESYSIIATHSPVVLQEIPRRYVRVLQRFGSATQVVTPSAETFGENVGYLTTNVFDLDSTQTDYHSVLADLAEDMSVDRIERLFDEEMSVQARAYVIALQRRRK
ncbi:AAA family ATPase [Amycolatopsis sp. WQ 127309]|uniref:AAA family ATPase n=1 Tax=Amycolatopsis sp. WQ 127309 TaxID=2932773 RepID=UPI001FF571D4|nr:AAA family ATPase [Amycolatopsis sp. WQ 127309]UOZ08828.1 ATP-binding protein [Amycolatopsis sp. WQ 127309]